MNVVITIGRAHGSGGRHIGKIIAEKLGIECYDTRFITEAAERNGISEKVFQSYNERPVNSLLYSIAMAGSAIPRLARNNTERPLHGVCPCCGAEVRQNPGRKVKRFCSDKCRNAWWNSRLEQVDRKAHYKFVCACCKKPFTAYGNAGRKYCSHECYIKDRFGGGQNAGK